jgi:DUF971 family protein
MSFWKTLKPAQTAPQPTAVELSKDRATVSLTWSDGLANTVSARTLRQACPCAGCVDEWSGKRTLDPASVPADTVITQVSPVGNYALCFTFGDGHATGLYVFDLLRKLSTPAA